MKNKIKNKNNGITFGKKICSKQRLSGIIFARSCCSIGIIIYHYFCHSNGNFKFLFKTGNSTWGFLFVTSFFSISGTVLFYNYSTISSFKSFYFKRWKSIFPSYYICFIYFFLKNVFRYRKLFYISHWSNLFFSIIGLDGFLAYRFKTYYLVGEWFLGAIIIIYFIYPLLSFLMNINFLIINFIIFAYYLLNYYNNNIIILDSRNIVNCINSFYFGMIAIKFQNLFFKNKIIFIISFIILLFLYFIRISKIILLSQIHGFSLYITLVQIGEYVMKCRFRIIFIEIGNLSYNIFLFQHLIILDVLGVNNPTEWYYHILLLGITIILTIICAKVLFIVVNNLFQNTLFKKIESFFIKGI